MTKHLKPHGNMNAAELVALFADSSRHPNALGYELKRCKWDVLISLAYGEHAPNPVADVPAGLAEAAYDESDRRVAARKALFGAIGR